ncbi:TPA: helix-turn-helix domain-containing protein [Yersinia enterocolitica]|uniref:XRE family transcriptional regulator n=1 Tax=Yersinia aleksiciae TaxID=263819 RepID=A0A0T9V1I8_YERAE|nr:MULTISPECIES: S24 family peptidase [Yersinia]EKN3404903.1 helix-turn-helix domain-containing protein [Yersinia enterocolitica]EKN3995335.1 helix-turn-helix domain-containing protein [Yersinia enterocolitica]EKN5086302.1 helix-turn-helix domain-containing protein [Yersinia enterocolitica]EKN6403718.1 helix-turn-helix domain-containing protein [Yersinia enterocolitica]EKP3834299.1 helix-turn-helix domain-containing protein [Yersinia enterocolitica]
MKNETVGQRIRKRRKELRITQETLGNRIGVKGAAVSQWEDDKTAPNGDNLLSLARELQCAPEFILYGENSASNVEPAKLDSRMVPVLSYVQAGAWTAECTIRSLDGDLEFLQTNLDLSSSAFALIIKGRSMEPDFSEGDSVIIDPEVFPLPGDFVAAENGEHEALFKKYRPRGIINGKDVFELVPLNDDYPILRSDSSHIRIIGTMMEHRKYRKRR